MLSWVAVSPCLHVSLCAKLEERDSSLRAQVLSLGWPMQIRENEPLQSSTTPPESSYATPPTKKKQLAFEVILFACFVGILGWYFVSSYLRRHATFQVQERTLTVHDNLYSIGSRHDSSSIAVGNFGLILLTNDGGTTWHAHSSGTLNPLMSVSFADSLHGWIVGTGGTILRSDDGGNSWKIQPSGTKEHLLKVYALSPTKAFVVGAFGTLLSTSDGGGTWSRQELPWEKLIPRVIEENGYLEPNLNAVYFANDDQGWIVGEFGLILQTRDGGRTWVSQNSGPNLPQLFAVTFQGPNRGWAVGQAGTILETTDSGRHWTKIEAATGVNLNGIAMDNDRGVIVGNGIVLASYDGGSTWKQKESVAQGRWLSGVAVNNQEVIAVGQAGTVQKLDLDMSF